LDRIEGALIVATALVAVGTPGLAGALAKLKLDRLGKPTLTWQGGAIAVVPITIAVGAAWLGFALACRWALHRWQGEPRRINGIRAAWAAGLAGGVYTSAPMLYEILREDGAVAMALALLMPWAYWRYVLSGAVVAGAVAYALAWLAGMKKAGTRPASS
jgi:hypothetical protein